MSCNWRLWNSVNHIDVTNYIPENVLKISNIDKHLYLLTADNNLYHGVVEVEENCITFEKNESDFVDIDTCDSHLYTVSKNGEVHKRDSSLEILDEIALFEDSKTCLHGHSNIKCKIKVQKIYVNKFGKLFITKSGQLWGSGYMPQIGINSELPKKITFFDGRHTYAAGIGYDFAVAIVSKQIEYDDHDECEEAIPLRDCPVCLSASFPTSPISQNSLSESCPLGLKLNNSYDIETTSTSSKNDSDSSTNDSYKPANGSTQSADECIDTDKTEKNILVRNTEIAKQFLSRKISWMSSAGEEYLAECTERPSRILKENVTSMASFVYEGVKTVGDKVATLSRHVSGSSDYNDFLENSDIVNVSRSTSRDDFRWSLSQGTSEHDVSEQGLNDRVKVVLTIGSTLINSEIWTWGNIMHGQLGIGDNIRRERPMKITKLLNIGVCKVSVQSHHASVLTLDGRVFLWGRNDFNQVTLDSRMDQSSPKLFTLATAERISDVTCGCFHTVILSDKLNVYYFGVGSEKMVNLCSNINTSNGDANDAEKTQLAFLFTNLLCCNMYTLLNQVNVQNNYITEHLAKQQKLLEEMLMVHVNLIKPLMKKSSLILETELYELLCEKFIDLLYITAANVESLQKFRNNLISEVDIIMIKYAEEYIFVHNKYLSTVCDVVAIDGFNYLSKALDVHQYLYKLRPDISKKDKNSEEQIISSLLMEPVEMLPHYIATIEDLSKHSKTNSKIMDTFLKWVHAVENQEVQLMSAAVTQEFWAGPGKYIDSLKSPNRRLIRSSHSHPIYLYNSSRFSSHSFILFSDIFVHVSGSTPTVHNLSTIWIDHLPTEGSNQHQLSLKMPEDSLVLYTSEPENKIEWFHTFQNAIKIALNKKDAIQPPLIRRASYTFTKNGMYKDAKYTGRWLNAKMHVSGKLEWKDGRVYTGQFTNNQLSGSGRMDIPNVGIYEGQWKDNHQNGFGIFNYSNMDVYKGHFKDGQPHGHGILRKGTFKTSTASIYIGEWIAGAKNGYGVMDDITNGEKYLGNWSDNKKHGNGLVVTSDGVYYEGNFNQDIFTGYGLMIAEDGTRCEGDFRGIGILGGKGKLNLNSGHVIEGYLTGNWNEGIKISNGTCFKASPTPETPKSFETLCLPVSQKWKALFLCCYQMLGISDECTNGNKLNDTKKIWQNVAVYLSNSHQSTMKKNKSERLENSLNHLDIIPPYGKVKLDAESYKELQQYLLRAFDSPFHPLGSLLSDLCVAYTTTYGGMVAHPLLLKHAVSELHSITKRLYEIVNMLFPALPPYGTEYLIQCEESDEVISCCMLLYPIILPKVYSSLFILYTLKNKEQDAKYWKRLLEWNKHSDYTLMSFLSVNPKFLKADTDQTCPIKDCAYAEAVEMLQQLKTTFSPVEKLSVILETVKKMTPVIHEQLGKDYTWNMDDFFPIFMYVVVRARILQLGSELEFIENFMEPSLHRGELGHIFTSLKACYEQILQEKTSIN